MWSLYRRNPAALWGSVGLHCILLFLLLVSSDWLWRPRPIDAGPDVIQAGLVDADRLALMRERLERASSAEAAQRQAQAARLEAERAAVEQARRAAEEEARRQAEAAQRQAERAAAEQARRANEDETALQRALAEEAMQQALNEEVIGMDRTEGQALRGGRRAGIDLDPYKSAIRDQVQRMWVRPPGSTGMQACEVKVSLRPGGEVIAGSVKIAGPCGDRAYRSSIETAIFRASPLPVPKGSDFREFEQLNFKFEPR